jgi:hypothetical protein
MTAPRKPKTQKTAKPEKALREKKLYTLAPWSCRHFPDHSEIEAYVAAAGDWQTIADVRQTAGSSAEEMANFIAHVVNNHDKLIDLLDDMISALEACLACKGLEWSAEYDADIILRRAKAART